MDREFKGNNISKLVSNYVLVDIETTGFSPQNDDIIEIGAIKVKENEVIDEYQSLVKTNRSLNSRICDLTGITNDMLKDGKEAKQAIHEFLEFVGDDILVAHNANFDINFLYDKSNLYTNRYLKNDFIDTMKLAKKILPNLPNYKLGTLAEYYNIDYSNAHRGLEDVKITYEVYNKLKEEEISFI